MAGEYEQTLPIADIDIWRAADQMMRLYGEAALLRSAMRADALLDQGDTQGFFVWKRITRAIDDLGRRPPPGVMAN